MLQTTHSRSARLTRIYHGTSPRVFIQRDEVVQNRDEWPDYQARLKTEGERMFRVLVPKAKEFAG